MARPSLDPPSRTAESYPRPAFMGNDSGGGEGGGTWGSMPPSPTARGYETSRVGARGTTHGVWTFKRSLDFC